MNTNGSVVLGFLALTIAMVTPAPGEIIERLPDGAVTSVRRRGTNAGHAGGPQKSTTRKMRSYPHL